MAEIADLIDADYWVWSQVVQNANTPPVIIRSIHNFTGTIRDDFIKATTDAAVPDPAAKAIHQQLLSGNRQVTMRRSDLMSKEDWQLNEQYRKYRQKMGIDEWLYCFNASKDPSISFALAFHRIDKKAEFSVDDVEIVNLIARKISWLYEDSPTQATRVLNLRPRMLELLGFILEGYGDKDIAENMRLSPHTIRGYVKDLFRHFTVSSRNELMASILNPRVINC